MLQLLLAGGYMKRVIGLGGIFFKAKTPKHCTSGIASTLASRAQPTARCDVA